MGSNTWRGLGWLLRAARSCVAGLLAAHLINAAAQIPETAWVHTLFTTANVNAVPGSGDAAFAKRAMTTDAAGNVYVTGTTHNGVDTDILTIKYSASGAIVWRATANGPARKDDRAYAIAVDAVGNVAVAGDTDAGTHKDAIVIKYDSNGQEVWRRTYDGGVVRDDYAFDVAFASNGDVIMTGTVGVVAFSSNNSNYLTQRYSAADGAVIWSQQFDGLGQSADRPAAMAIDSAGNVIVTGTSTSSSGFLEILTVKYGGDGMLLASARIGAAALNNVASTIATDAPGNVYVSGTSTGYGPSYPQGNANFFTLKYDANLTEIWQATYNGGQDKNDSAQALKVDSVGNVYVLGTTDRTIDDPLGPTNPGYTIVKYLSDGSEAWSKSFEGSGTGSEFASALAIDGAGNIILGAYAGNAGIYVPTLFTLEPLNGNTLWSAPLAGLPAQNGAALLAAHVGASNEVVVAGLTSTNGNGDFVVAKVNSTGSELWRANEGNATGLATSFVGGLTHGGALGVDGLGTAFVTGRTGSGPAANVLSAAIASDGTLQWQRTVNGGGNGFDQGVSVSPSGSVAFVASDATESGAVRQLLTKYDGAGNATWGRVISNPGSTQDTVKAVLSDGSGDVFVTGTTTVGGDVNFFTTYVNGVSGNEIWRNVDGASGGPDVPVAIVRDASNNVYVAGSSNNAGVESMRVVKYGVAPWQAVIDPPMGATRIVRAMALDNAGALYVAGDVLIKFSLGGAEQWRVSPGIVAQAVTVDSSGAVIVAGSNGAIVKYSGAGTELWRTAVNGVEDANNVVYALGTDVLNAVYSASRNSADPQAQYVVTKTDAAGLYVWRMEFPTADIEGNVPPAMRVMADRSVYLAGNASASGAPPSMTVWKIIQPTPAPTLTAAIPGNGQATFYFDPPNGNGGSPITSYTVFCNGGLIASSGTASPMTVGGLSNGTPYSCHITANNLFGNGRASNVLFVTPQVSPPLMLVEAFSRKTHGSAGTFEKRIDITRPVTGAVSIEPRQLGTTQSLRLRFNANVTSVGAVTVEDHLMQPAGSATAAPNGQDVILTMSNIANGTRIRIALSGLNGSATAELALAYLVGDINATAITSAADVAAVKSKSGNAANAQFYLYDVDGSGTINAADVSAVKARTGVRLP